MIPKLCIPQRVGGHRQSFSVVMTVNHSGDNNNHGDNDDNNSNSNSNHNSYKNCSDHSGDNNNHGDNDDNNSNSNSNHNSYKNYNYNTTILKCERATTANNEVPRAMQR